MVPEIVIHPERELFDKAEDIRWRFDLSNQASVDLEIPGLEWRFAVYDGASLEPVMRAYSILESVGTGVLRAGETVELYRRPVGWDGLVDGARISPGTYIVGAELFSTTPPVRGLATFSVESRSAILDPAAIWKSDPWWHPDTPPSPVENEGEAESRNPAEGPTVQVISTVGYGFYQPHPSTAAGRRWGDGDMPGSWFYNGTNRPSYLDSAATRSAFAAAFNTWADIQGSYFRMSDGGDTGRSGNNNDGFNVADWCPSCLPAIDGVTPIAAAWAFTAVWNDRRIVDSDFVIDRNAAGGWTLDPPTLDGYDAQSVALHEIGHWLFLRDLYDPAGSGTFCTNGVRYQSWMGSANCNMVMAGVPYDTARRALQWGDMAGARYAYPDRYAAYGGIGANTVDAGADTHLINSGTVPDLVAGYIDDPGSGDDISYRVGVDLGPNSGQAASWGNPLSGPQNIGDTTAGFGIAIENVDSNSRPDIFFVWMDDPGAGVQNEVRYMIHFNVDTAGANPTSTYGPAAAAIPNPSGNIGDRTQGLGACIRNIDTDPRMELVVGWADNPDFDNHIRYSIGRNVNADGTIGDGWITPIQQGTALGWETAGVGVECTNMNEVSSPDIMFAWVDAVPFGRDRIYYLIGFDMETSGAAGWSTEEAFADDAIGDETHGLGLGYANVGGSSVGEASFVYVNDPGASNDLKYRNEWDMRWNAHV